MKASDPWSAMFLVAIGILCTLLYLAYRDIDAKTIKIAAIEKSQREAWSKVYDLQENHDDRCFSEEATMHLKLFEAEKALGECQAKVKP